MVEPSPRADGFRRLGHGTVVFHIQRDMPEETRQVGRAEPWPDHYNNDVAMRVISAGALFPSKEHTKQNKG